MLIIIWAFISCCNHSLQITIAHKTIMTKFETLRDYQNVTLRHEVSKCCWTNSTDWLAQCRVAANLSFGKSSVSVKCNKVITIKRDMPVLYSPFFFSWWCELIKCLCEEMKSGERCRHVMKCQKEDHLLLVVVDYREPKQWKVKPWIKEGLLHYNLLNLPFLLECLQFVLS